MKTSFKNYHEENPHIYEEFKRLAKILIKRGYIRLGSKQIMEYIRFETKITGNDKFKINNNYTSGYSRLFEKDFPEYNGYFSKRLVINDLS